MIVNRVVAPASAALVLWAAVAGAQPADREQVWRVSRSLDQAVGQVTRSTYAWAFTPERGQGALIPGYGVVFVLSPRPLATQENLRVRNLVRPRPMQRMTRLENTDVAALAAVEAQLAAHQKEMEEADRALARAMAELERAVRLRAVPAPTPVSPPVAAPTPAALPVPPPWTVWFGDDEAETRAPEAVIAEVRSAVFGVLTAEASSLAFVQPDEQMVVAVNFVPEGFLDTGAQPMRTLVVRARKKDLVDRSTGRISAEELTKRAETVEY